MKELERECPDCKRVMYQASERLPGRGNEVLLLVARDEVGLGPRELILVEHTPREFRVEVESAG